MATGFESNRQTRRRRIPGRLRNAVVLAAGMTAFVWLLAGLGITDAADSNLRRLYYQLRGERADGHDVVFVAMDESTVDAWGSPPWSWQRYADMVVTIQKSKPRLIAFLEPGPRILPGDVPVALADLRRAIAANQVVTPPARAGFGQPRLEVGPRGVVEAVLLGDPRSIDGPSITRTVLQHAGLTFASPRVPVNYFGGPDSLPTVPAHRIASGEIPVDTFAGRIVVIGLRGERFAPIVPTPVGPMSPSEVHAHALLSLANGRTWHTLPFGVDLAAGFLLALLCGWLLPRLRTGGVVLILAGQIAVVLIADYVAFASGWVLLGSAVPISAMAGAASLAWIRERTRASRELESLTRWLTQTAAQRRGRETEEAGQLFWERFADAAKIYLDFDSTFFGELAPGTWHLRFRTFVNAAETDIDERRRDIRRNPYKRAYLSHKPVWVDNFMVHDRGVRSLMVPLVAFNRALGFWVVNFDKNQRVGRNLMGIIEQLADQISLAIERTRLEGMLADSKSRSKHRLPTEGQLIDSVREMREAAQGLVQEQQSLATLFDRLPVGVMVATLWGDVQFANESMRRFMRHFDRLGDQDPQRFRLSSLISEMTGGTENVVHEMLRELVTDGHPVRLSGRVAPTLGPAIGYEIAVSRLAQGDRGKADDEQRGMRLLSDFVLTVTEHVEKRADVTDWTMKLKETSVPVGELVDLRVVLRKIVAEVQAAKSGRQTRPIMLEMPESLPAVRADKSLPATLAQLLGDAITAPGDDPVRLVVEAARQELSLHIIDPQSVLPRGEVEAVRRPGETGDDLPEHLQNFIAAKRAIEAGQARFELNSGMEGGTVIGITLPRRRSGD